MYTSMVYAKGVSFNDMQLILRAMTLSVQFVIVVLLGL